VQNCKALPTGIELKGNLEREAYKQTNGYTQLRFHKKCNCESSIMYTQYRREPKKEKEAHQWLSHLQTVGRGS
jgi:hypothetical protein